jgi:hypothetical protein
MRRVFWVALLLAAACRERAVTAPNAGCPPEAVLEELHGALFVVEHGGPVEMAEARLAHARADLADGPRSGEGEALAEAIGRAIALERKADPQARFELESARLRLTESPCFDRAAHDRWHARLDAGTAVH